MNVPEPQRTYALIVGIEKYVEGRDLDGPASDALKFADWLLTRNVPIDNIQLYISELSKPDIVNNNQSLQLLWGKTQKATFDNIRTAITEVIPKNKDKGDLLYIFWGGHGVTIGRDERRFFYDDGFQNLNLNYLLESLNSDFFGILDRQILIFDACANYYSKQLTSLPDYKFPCGEQVEDRKQVVLLATEKGSMSINLDKEKTGLFSKILLQELNKQDNLLSTESINKIIENVQNIFNKDHKNDQRPVFLSYEDQYGNRPSRMALTKSAKQFDILDSQWQEFVKIINVLKWHNISRYYYQFLSIYRDNNDPEGNYTDLSKENNFDYLKEILLEIKLDRNHESNLPLVVEFAQFLFESQQSDLLAIKNELNQWINQTSQELGIDSNTLNQLSKVKHDRQEETICKIGLPYLLILVEPNIHHQSKLEFKAELIFEEMSDSQEVKRKTVTLIEDKSIDVNSEDIEYICSKVYQFIEESNKKLVFYKNVNKLTIELFLPNKYLVAFAPEIQKIPINESKPEWFGSRYKFVLRSYDRYSGSYSYHHSLLSKWKKLSDLQDSLTPETIKKRVICLKKLEKNYNWKKLGKQLTKFINININCPLLEESYTCHIEEFLTSIFRHGIPFAFWLRGNLLENLKLREEEKIDNYEFEDVLTVDNIKKPEKLFESIRIIREDAYVQPEEKQIEYLGYHLGFLFDDPHRLHSKFDKNLGDDVFTGF